jgi:CRP-like cAMP-binding protein
MRSHVVQNQVLAGMAPAVFDRIRQFLRPVAVRRRAVLQEYNRSIENVYFIERGVASLLARTQRDGPVEVAIVGRLGFVGVPVVLGIPRSPNRCLMEVPGSALRISAEALRRVIHEAPAVQRHLLSYVHALLVQNTQTALCNVRHGLEERLCRWLLLAADRLDETSIPLTHAQLSMILGVRRAGVTTALSRLERVGAVAKTRGSVVIADRALLESQSCECYRIIAAEYKRLGGASLFRHVLEDDEGAVRDLDEVRSPP